MSYNERVWMQSPHIGYKPHLTEGSWITQESGNDLMICEHGHQSSYLAWFHDPTDETRQAVEGICKSHNIALALIRDKLDKLFTESPYKEGP